MNGTNHVHEQHPFFAQAVEEHRGVHRAVEEIHRLLDHQNAKPVTCLDVTELTQRVTGLRDRLQRHFEAEELGGYLEEAVTRLPSIAPQAAILQKQHGEFLRLAEQMVAHVKCGATPAEVWRKLGDDYRLFAKQLLAHEAAENTLLERAFNEDLGRDP